MLLKYVLIQHLRRQGIFSASDGRALSKLTTEEIQREYERARGVQSHGLVQGDRTAIGDHHSL
ncbi:Fur-regulated basic protein FbpA [Geobacillus stearothermophilus]|uniref:Fur-regulated basic protein FbpA n=1 Tax=Geobacillus stearothermophilus TaxID=1422 RepID=UPI002E1F2CE7|nr:Fur-regulated basic protein FbpA [Geobacillus stearothermophilus]MED4830653.1 Fur-regulated basic protein FbpA [Geobacillus stearothermophilus]MED4960301.1 Fur-regulated basic protein FbpA [Geobacillus stearothermophilus]